MWRLCVQGTHFPGLIPLILTYLDIIKADDHTKAHISHYLNFVEARASGDVLTPATWTRKFVQSHPAYKKDSVVSDEIAHDLLVEIAAIAEGRKAAPELLGNFLNDRLPLPAAPLPLDSGHAEAAGVVSAAVLMETPPRRRLRGASFAEEAGASECLVIKYVAFGGVCAG